MNEITEDLLHRLYIEEKKSLREVGLIIGRSTKQVWRYLKKFNIPTRAFSTKGLQVRLGAKLSEESITKIKKSLTGRKLPSEQRDKVIKTLHHGSGSNNNYWKGGRIITDKGYIKIKILNGYEYEHRMIVEKDINRKLIETEEVHHLNGNKRDNRIENLAVLNPDEHAKIHNKNKIWIKYKIK